MTYMRSWKSHRLTSHTWLGLNQQIGRPLKDCRCHWFKKNNTWRAIVDGKKKVVSN
jgi:hypothetical protein